MHTFAQKQKPIRQTKSANSAKPKRSFFGRSKERFSSIALMQNLQAEPWSGWHRLPDTSGCTIGISIANFAKMVLDEISGASLLNFLYQRSSLTAHKTRIGEQPSRASLETSTPKPNGRAGFGGALSLCGAAR